MSAGLVCVYLFNFEVRLLSCQFLFCVALSSLLISGNLTFPQCALQPLWLSHNVRCAIQQEKEIQWAGEKKYNDVTNSIIHSVGSPCYLKHLPACLPTPHVVTPTQRLLPAPQLFLFLRRNPCSRATCVWPWRNISVVLMRVVVFTVLRRNTS